MRPNGRSSGAAETDIRRWRWEWKGVIGFDAELERDRTKLGNDVAHFGELMETFG